MRGISFAFVSVGILIASPSYGSCTKPDAPLCALQAGRFAGVADFDNCRLQMVAYKDGMEALAQCHKQAGQSSQEQSALDELQGTLDRFNRKARGE